MASKTDEIQDLVDALQIADRCWKEEHVTILAANAQVCIAKILNEIRKSMQKSERVMNSDKVFAYMRGFFPEMDMDKV